MVISNASLFISYFCGLLSQDDFLTFAKAISIYVWEKKLWKMKVKY